MSIRALMCERSPDASGGGAAWLEDDATGTIARDEGSSIPALPGLLSNMCSTFWIASHCKGVASLWHKHKAFQHCYCWELHFQMSWQNQNTKEGNAADDFLTTRAWDNMHSKDKLLERQYYLHRQNRCNTMFLSKAKTWTLSQTLAQTAELWATSLHLAAMILILAPVVHLSYEI